VPLNVTSSYRAIFQSLISRWPASIKINDVMLGLLLDRNKATQPDREATQKERERQQRYFFDDFDRGVGDKRLMTGLLLTEQKARLSIKSLYRSLSSGE
jgi:hypothetical protein